MHILSRPHRTAAPGQTVVLLAIVIVVLLAVAALVVDLGVYYNEKARLQNVVDTAALAAAEDMPDQTAAENTVFQVLEANGYFLGQDGVQGIDLIPNPDGQHPTRYLIQVSKTLPPYFSRIIGYHGTTIEAQATGAFMVNNIVPWMFYLPDMGDCEVDQVYRLKVGPVGAAWGNFNCLALGGRGAQVYKQNIINGYQGSIEIGRLIETEPGNMSGPTQDGVNQRMEDEKFIVVCPSTYDRNPQGRDELTVHGFTAFWLLDCGGQGKNCWVDGRFMEYREIPYAQGGPRTCLLD